MRRVRSSVCPPCPADREPKVSTIAHLSCSESRPRSARIFRALQRQDAACWSRVVFVPGVRAVRTRTRVSRVRVEVIEALANETGVESNKADGPGGVHQDTMAMTDSWWLPMLVIWLSRFYRFVTGFRE